MNSIEHIVNEVKALKEREARLRALLLAADLDRPNGKCEFAAPVPANGDGDGTAVETGYRRLIGRVREATRVDLPAGAVVAVVSRGDEELVRLGKRTGWHFPRAADGVYAGHHPADSAEAVANLEAVRAAGAGFLLFPATAFWWLEHYTDFRQHLEGRFRRVRADADCVIYALATEREDVAMRQRLEALAAEVERISRSETDLRAELAQFQEQLRQRDEQFRTSLYNTQVTLAALQQKAAEPPAALPDAANSTAGSEAYRALVAHVRSAAEEVLPPGTMVAVVSRGDEELLRLGARTGWHFPRAASGAYAGHHPADSAEAVSCLESVRAHGARYLIFPATAFWWLVFYDGMARHLDAKYRRIRSDARCIIYDLAWPAPGLVRRLARRLFPARNGHHHG